MTYLSFDHEKNISLPAKSGFIIAALLRQVYRGRDNQSGAGRYWHYASKLQSGHYQGKYP